MRVMLAGVPVRDDLVVELAGLLTNAGSFDIAARILHAHAEGQKLIALTIEGL